MITKEITFQKVYNLGNYSSERIEITGILEPGETVNDALNQARVDAAKNHNEHNAHLYKDNTPDIPVIPKPSIDVSYGKTVKGEFWTTSLILEEQIKSCSELKVLESYKFIVKGKPDLENAYNQKLKELT